MKLKTAAILAILFVPSLAMAQFHGGGGFGRGGGGYHGGGYGHGYDGYHGGYRGYDHGYHGGGRSFFDFSLGFGGFYDGYYPSYGYTGYSPSVVYSSPAPVVSYGNYDYYGGGYYNAPVVVEPAPIVTRTYIAPPIQYSRPYYGGYYAPSYNFSAHYYYRH